MRYLLLFLYVSSFSLTAQRMQGLYTSGVWRQKDVEKDIDRALNKSKEKMGIITSSKNNINDTLIYFVKRAQDIFTIKMTFDYLDHDSSERYCNYQEYIFDCTPCSQRHLAEFLNDFGFRRQSLNTYISSYAYKTKMTVRYKGDNQDCLTLTFQYFHINKKSYKKLYKDLNKKTTA